MTGLSDPSRPLPEPVRSRARLVFFVFVVVAMGMFGLGEIIKNLEHEGTRDVCPWLTVPAAVPPAFAAIVIFLMLFEWNWVRGPIGRWATARYDREIVLAGDLDVRLFIRDKLETLKRVLEPGFFEQNPDDWWRSTAQALKDFLPVDATLNATTIQNHTLAVAQRCEDKLGEEQWAFVEGCPADWATLPIPDGPMTVGIDGGYVRHWGEKQQHFEVIVGKSILAFRRDDEEDIPSSKGFQEQYTSSQAGHDGACPWRASLS